MKLESYHKDAIFAILNLLGLIIWIWIIEYYEKNYGYGMTLKLFWYNLTHWFKSIFVF